MSLSMYQASVPVFIHGLTNLSAILTKAEAYAHARKIDPSVLINARLAPDMFPLSKQVQIAGDMSKNCAFRLSGTEVQMFEDTEKTFPELQARIAKTIALLKTFKASQIDGSEERDIQIKTGNNDMQFKGQDYLLHFVLPNVYFHLTTAYDILRHNGLDLGKKDFLGNY